MADNHSRQIFVNLSVRDLPRSIDFFKKLGFTFNPKFTDEKAACMVVNGNAYVMLLTQAFFKSFTKREICNTGTHTEGLFAFSCSSREQVDDLGHRAVEAGGSYAGEPMDHGFMYSRSFYDPDGHHWELFWMDPKAAA